MTDYLDAWKKIVPAEMQRTFFARLEENLNRLAAQRGELLFTVPFAYFGATKSS
ncbi:MAG TPA: hypothetical protein VL992_07735 [Tepidisphaeraceae bacterium]|nr:hypothetical protein [Tepidisphaeraceae bacterium]